MNNTKRSLIFTASILAATLLFALMLRFFPSLSMRMAFYLTFYGLTPTLFAIVRRLYLNPQMDRGEAFFQVDTRLRVNQIRLILYTILIITEYRFYNTLFNPTMLLTILTFLVISETYLYLSGRSTKVIFYNNGIIVSGYDFRIDLPLNDNMQTVSGVYGYGDFETCLVDGQNIQLEMTNKRGTLSMQLPADKVPHITAFIQSKGILLDRA